MTSSVPVFLYAHSINFTDLLNPHLQKSPPPPVLTIPEQFKQYYTINTNFTLKGNDDINVCCDCNQPIEGV